MHHVLCVDWRGEVFVNVIVRDKKVISGLQNLNAKTIIRAQAQVDASEFIH